MIPPGTGSTGRNSAQQGFTVLLTGLPGAGKSTTAGRLAARLRELDQRSVTVLDGDVIRKKISPDLGFTPGDRNENIRRIGDVAAEISRKGGICICASIAPYDDARQALRKSLASAGGFLLVYISTPVNVCEARDRKGLYARARAGTLPQFTGVSDPYEPPADSEITIDTTAIGPGEAAGIILGRLRGEGYLSPGDL